MSLLLDLAQHLPDRDARHRVETGGRLVQKEDAGFVHEPAGDLDPASHPARQVLDLLVGPLGELDCVEELGNESRAAFARDAVELRVDQEVLAHAQLDVARHRLRNHADRPPHVVGLPQDVEAVDERRPRRRREQRRQHPDERGLAGAVRAEQAEDFPFFDVEAHALDGGEVAEALDEIADFDGVHGDQFASGSST